MPSSVEFLGEVRAFVNTRPRRLAYLVQQGNYTQLADAVAYATSEWGGFSQPILPVARKRRIYPRWWQFAETLLPEVFLDFVGIHERLKAAIQSAFNADVISMPMVGTPEPGIHSTVVHARDSMRGRTVFLPAENSTYGEKLALGIIPEEWREPWRELGAPLEPAQSADELLRAQTGASPSPIWLTREHTGIYQSQGFLGCPVIVFSDRMPPWRLLTFWNVRAAAAGNFGPPLVLFVPPRYLDDPSVGALLRELSLNRLVTPDVVFVGKDEDHLRSAAESHGFIEGQGGTSFTLSNPPRPRDLSEKPLTYRVNLDPRTWVMGTRMDGVRTPVIVNMTSPVLRVRVETAVPLQAFGGFIRTDIQGIDALEWPHSPSVARLIDRNAEYTRFGLSFVEAPNRQVDKSLLVPTPDAVLSAFLADRDWQWEVSDKGRYGQALVSSVGQSDGLRSLLSRLALRTVFALASLRRQKVEQTLTASGTDLDAPDLEAMLRDLLAAGQQRWRTSADIAGALTVTKRAIVPVLTSLVRDGLVHRGLGFRCPSCTLETPVPLDRVRDHMRCDGCGFSAPVVSQDEGEPEILYVLNSLLDRVIEQDVLGHLLVTPIAERDYGAIRVIPGATVRQPSAGIEREVDLLGLSRSRVLIGEVKSKATAFTATEVTSNVDLAKKLGASLLILGAMDEWTKDSREIVEAATPGQGLEVAVIGLSQMFPPSSS